MPPPFHLRSLDEQKVCECLGIKCCQNALGVQGPRSRITGLGSFLEFECARLLAEPEAKRANRSGRCAQNSATM